MPQINNKYSIIQTIQIVIPSSINSQIKLKKYYFKHDLKNECFQLKTFFYHKKKKKLTYSFNWNRTD